MKQRGDTETRPEQALCVQMTCEGHSLVTREATMKRRFCRLRACRLSHVYLSKVGILI